MRVREVAVTTIPLKKNGDMFGDYIRIHYLCMINCIIMVFGSEEIMRCGLRLNN